MHQQDLGGNSIIIQTGPIGGSYPHIDCSIFNFVVCCGDRLFFDELATSSHYDGICTSTTRSQHAFGSNILLYSAFIQPKSVEISFCLQFSSKFNFPNLVCNTMAEAVVQLRCGVKVRSRSIETAINSYERLVLTFYLE